MNSTDMINYALDAQYDYNIKLILLILLGVYAGFAIWYSKRMEIKFLYQYYLQGFLKVLAIPYFIVLPLWVLFLQRGVKVDVILQIMLVFYGIIVILAGIFTFLYGGEKIKSFFTGEGFYRRYKK